MTIQAILNQNLEEIKHYKKLNLKIHQMLEEFFKKHLELMFMRFDFNIIIEVIEKILIPSIR